MRQVSALDAAGQIRSGQRIFIQGAAATPFRLIEALVARASELRDVEIMHLHTMGDAPYADERYRDSFRVANLFVGANMRRRLDYERVDYLPCFLSEIPHLFRSGRRPIDVALIQVSPPDQHGICSLGTSVDVTRAAVESAKLVLAEINPRMPRMHGDGFISIDDIDAWIEIDVPLPEVPRSRVTDIEARIGRFVGERIEDGSTLQIGIGAVPDAVLAALKDHKHLGIHTEMWSDGALDLIRCGAVDNSRKCVHPGKTVSAFMTGSQALYDFAHDNPTVVQLDVSYVNDVRVISRNPKVAAINSAVEIDLTGQVCADSIGSRIISGVGGQMDFIRGATYSVGGQPIIALTSRSKNGEPRIVPTLRAGAGVVTTRAHVHIVATEYGLVDLYGMTLAERARALIGLAHPDDRDGLEKKWWALAKGHTSRDRILS